MTKTSMNWGPERRRGGENACVYYRVGWVSGGGPKSHKPPHWIRHLSTRSWERQLSGSGKSLAVSHRRSDDLMPRLDPTRLPESIPGNLCQTADHPEKGTPDCPARSFVCHPKTGDARRSARKWTSWMALRRYETSRLETRRLQPKCPRLTP